MKIIDKRQSIETCTEAGWDAFDFITDEPLDDDFIQKIGSVGGSFIYMKMLRKPFFKVESHNYIVKGVKGDNHFRMAVHKDYLCETDRVKSLLNN